MPAFSPDSAATANHMAAVHAVIENQVRDLRRPRGGDAPLTSMATGVNPLSPVSNDRAAGRGVECGKLRKPLPSVPAMSCGSCDPSEDPRAAMKVRLVSGSQPSDAGSCSVSMAPSPPDAMLSSPRRPRPLHTYDMEPEDPAAAAVPNWLRWVASLIVGTSPSSSAPTSSASSASSGLFSCCCRDNTMINPPTARGSQRITQKSAGGDDALRGHVTQTQHKPYSTLNDSAGSAAETDCDGDACEMGVVAGSTRTAEIVSALRRGVELTSSAEAPVPPRLARPVPAGRRRTAAS
jgi:hypothetical protein